MKKLTAFGLSTAIGASFLLSSCISTPNTPDPTDPGSGGDISQPIDPDTGDETVVDSRSIDFNPNDVTILMPAPRNAFEASNNLINMSDNGIRDRLFSQDLLNQALDISRNNPVKTNAGFERSAQFLSSVLNLNDWVISAVRIDPAAPGASEGIHGTFGKSPQIRLVIQPVRAGVNPVEGAHDISLHLVYAFNGPKDPTKGQLHNTPDMVAFTAAVLELEALAERFRTEHGIDTSGDLTVHPAFENSVTGRQFRDALGQFLSTHLSMENLFGVSISAVPQPSPEPWILTGANVRPDGRLQPFPIPGITQAPGNFHTSQELNFTGGDFASPHSTSDLSVSGVLDKGADANVVMADINNVDTSFFFNRACLDCHGEGAARAHGVSQAVFQTRLTTAARECKVDPLTFTHAKWNFRALGWAPVDRFNTISGAHETINCRAAMETHEVVKAFRIGNWQDPVGPTLPDSTSSNVRRVAESFLNDFKDPHTGELHKVDFQVPESALVAPANVKYASTAFDDLPSHLTHDVWGDLKRYLASNNEDQKSENAKPVSFGAFSLQ